MDPAVERKKESVFWIEVEKIKPNPLQPRREFEESSLRELADSIRAYGLLQPIVVTRKEREVPHGRLVDYELLAGERRLRASKIAGLTQIPVIIREDTSDKVKLELALVENLQREDLNPIEKARAFRRLMEEFGMRQRDIAEKVGKSREVVANTMRLLSLPEDIQQAVAEGKITEGHTRPLLMVADDPNAQHKLYNDIIEQQLSVREAERRSRLVARDRARNFLDPETRRVQEQLETIFGTRVFIERKGKRGTISIEFFDDEELHGIVGKISLAENELASDIIPNERIATAPLLTPDVAATVGVSPEISPAPTTLVASDAQSEEPLPPAELV